MMLNETAGKVADFIQENNLLDREKLLTVAVSGGADSIALLYILHQLNAAEILNVRLSIAHLNHQLRDRDADADENFVIDTAKKLHLTANTKRIDVRGYAAKNNLSIETAARQLRLAALAEIAKTVNSGCLATAHHKNDNAETILHRIRRGTGFRGLAGIWPKKNFQDITFIRPLLCLSRSEIIDYLKEHNLNWRIDRTNYHLAYTRNYFRHRIIPALQNDCEQDLAELLNGLAAKSRQFYNLTCRHADKIRTKALLESDSEKAAFDLKIFSAQAQSVQVELARQALTGLGCGERNLTHRHYESILKLAVQNTAGGGIQLPNHFFVKRDGKKLIFEKSPPETGPPLEKPQTLKIPGKTNFADYTIEAAILDAQSCNVQRFKTEKTDLIEWFDLDRIVFPLIVRYRQNGDRFRPLGLTAEKRIGKFLTNSKIDHERRRNLLVFADNEKIIWLAPIRPAEETRITTQTKNILQLKITRDRSLDVARDRFGF